MLKKRTSILLSLLFPLLTMLALLGGVRPPATVQAAPTATLTVNSLADNESDGCAVNNCTLREAITDTISGGVIDFSVSGVINIGGNGQLVINKDLTISGTMPITVSGGNASRVFKVISGNVTFDSLTIADGNDQSSDCFTAQSCGGGIYMASGTAVTLTHTTVTSNSADYGSGIFNDSGTLTLNNSTISGNSAADNGGGIYNILAMLTLNNSTISDNSATYYGGGIFNDFSTLTLNNSTISGNSAADNGGGIYNYAGTLTLSTSIIANSTSGGDCVNAAGGTVTDNGFNLIEDGSNVCGLTDGTNNNIVGQDPSLGLLQDNGGSTLTHALLSGSPAIDTGDPAYAAGGYDQRGVEYDRVNNGRLDIGAYESTCATPIAVTSTDSSGAGTLRNAIIDVCNGDLIIFDATLSDQTIDISAGSPITGQLTISKNVTISGTVPITVSGGNASRVFNVTGGNVTFDSLTIAEGNDQSSDCFGTQSCGSGIYMTSGTAVTLTHTTMISSSADFGGGIFNTDGTLTINNSTISGNLADSDGGGIFNYVGTLTINNSTISGNLATSGGGIYNVGTLTINNSTINGNSATSNGGGINNVGTLTINNSTISGNSATSNGGGIYTTTFFNRLTINNSTISGNSATSNGGGIYNFSGTLTLNTSIIANSTSGGDCVNVSGAVTDNGFNLIEDSANACGLTNGTNNNIIGQDPSLEMLQDNGGPTLTHALLSRSPAIDAGDPAYSGGGYDQRGAGYDRVENGRLDIGAYETAVYTLTVTLDGTGGGLVHSFPSGITCGVDCSQAYHEGTAVILTATAPISSTFIGWAGACTGAGDCVVTMSEANAVTATFTLNTNVLTVLKDGTGDGTVTSISAGIDCGADCSDVYDYGTAVILTTTANAGYFAGWSGDCTGTGNCVVTMDAAKNVTATFTLYSTFLPVVMNNYASLPDLVVEDVTITADSLKLIIRNTGNAPLSGNFWVDMYINPDTPPTGINQTWETNGGEGLVWGVENLSLAQGEALTLTMSSPSYSAAYSNFSGTIAAESLVYVQVDSAGLSWFANVHELNEDNNINGPLITTDISTPAGILPIPSFSNALMEIRP